MNHEHVELVETSQDIINNTFPEIEGIDRNNLQMTNVGLFSVSKVEGANKLVELIQKYFKTNDLIITDGTGNVGSDTIPLALNFTHVNTIEKDEVEFLALKHNVETYKLNNVTLINGDTNDELKNLMQDVIYIDAPWGGLDYKKSQSIQLFMSNNEISAIYKKNKHKAKLFVFKVPKNYDFNNFIRKTEVTKYYIHSFEKNGWIKYYFIFVPTR